MRIGEGAVWATARPGVAAPVNEPLLNDHSAGLVPGHRAGVPTNGGMAGLLDTFTSPLGLDHICGI